MNTYYIIDDTTRLDSSSLEFIDSTDKLHFLVKFVPKKGELKNIIKNKYLQNMVSFDLVRNKDTHSLDFKMVPIIMEKMKSLKDYNVVLITTNAKLNCLRTYYQETFSYNLEISTSIRNYNITKYIQKELSTDYDMAYKVFVNLTRYRELRDTSISSDVLRRIEKRHLINKFIEATYISNDEISEKEFNLEIPERDSQYFQKFLEGYELGIDENALIKISYFLKKSDDYKAFEEKINSANNLNLSKATKRELLNKVKIDAFQMVF